MTGRPMSLWRNKSFVLLFSAQVVSLTGSGVTTVALALFARELAGGSPSAAIVGNALTLRILAFLLFSQPAGVLADRWSRKKILIAADVARFFLLALFPFITTVPQIYGLVFAINAVTAFATPAYEASIPSVVGKDHYVRALSISRVAVDAENALAPGVAGLLVAITSVRFVFWFDAATYLVSALLILGAVVPFVASPAPMSLRTFLSEIGHGTRVLLREPSLRQALIVSFAEATAGAAAIVVTVTYVQDVLLHSDSLAAIAMACVGVGSSLVALVLGRATRRMEAKQNDPVAIHSVRHRWSERSLIAGGFLLGLVLLPGALTPPFALFSLLWLLNGAGQALIAIPSSTLLAEHTAEKERGRAYAAHFALTHLCWLVTYPSVGHAAARFGAPLTFTGAGAVCLAVGALALVARGSRTPHAHDLD